MAVLSLPGALTRLICLHAVQRNPLSFLFGMPSLGSFISRLPLKLRTLLLLPPGTLTPENLSLAEPVASFIYVYVQVFHFINRILENYNAHGFVLVRTGLRGKCARLMGRC